jgi:hypothetical protein
LLISRRGRYQEKQARNIIKAQQYGDMQQGLFASTAAAAAAAVLPQALQEVARGDRATSTRASKFSEVVSCIEIIQINGP